MLLVSARTLYQESSIHSFTVLKLWHPKILTCLRNSNYLPKPKYSDFILLYLKKIKKNKKNTFQLGEFKMYLILEKKNKFNLKHSFL